MAVQQRHPMGCAVACVAAVLGTSYNAALQLFTHPEHAWTQGFLCNEICAALKKGGKPYSYGRAEKHKERLERVDSIVFTAPSDQYVVGHFLLRTATGWMNPWSNYPLMTPVRARVERVLPGRPRWVLYEKEG